MLIAQQITPLLLDEEEPVWAACVLRHKRRRDMNRDHTRM